MTFKLSIVIPTYKESNNIQELIFCINKNINLKKKDFEIIIVDDNSRDGIVNIYKILKKNMGVFMDLIDLIIFYQFLIFLKFQ